MTRQLLLAALVISTSVQSADFVLTNGTALAANKDVRHAHDTAGASVQKKTNEDVDLTQALSTHLAVLRRPASSNYQRQKYFHLRAEQNTPLNALSFEGANWRRVSDSQIVPVNKDEIRSFEREVSKRAGWRRLDQSDLSIPTRQIDKIKLLGTLGDSRGAFVRSDL